SGVDVSFDAPTKDWSARRNTPTVDLYLYDIREDLVRREVMWEPVRGKDGMVSGRKPPLRRFKFSYLVTAWTQRPEDEHRLFSSSRGSGSAARRRPTGGPGRAATNRRPLLRRKKRSSRAQASNRDVCCGCEVRPGGERTAGSGRRLEPRGVSRPPPRTPGGRDLSGAGGDGMATRERSRSARPVQRAPHLGDPRRAAAGAADAPAA